MCHPVCMCMRVTLHVRNSACASTTGSTFAATRVTASGARTVAISVRTGEVVDAPRPNPSGTLLPERMTAGEFVLRVALVGVPPLALSVSVLLEVAGASVLRRVVPLSGQDIGNPLTEELVRFERAICAHTCDGGLGMQQRVAGAVCVGVSRPDEFTATYPQARHTHARSS